MENKILDMVDKFALKLEALAAEYGPEVIDVTLSVVMIKGVQGLMTVLALLMLAVASFFVARYLLCVWGVKHAEDSEGSSFIPGVLVALGATTAGVSFVTHALNPWPWVALFAPKVYLAQQVLGL